MLAGNPEVFLRYELGDLFDRGIIDPDAWNEYLRVLMDPAAMHAMCEDYRAGASIDLERDAADSGKRVSSPLLILWGDRIPFYQRFDMLAVWRGLALIMGNAIRAGHYLAEEAPDQVVANLLPFLAAGDPPFSA